MPPFDFSAIAAQIIIYFLFNFELIVLTTGAVLTTGTPVHSSPGLQFSYISAIRTLSTTLGSA